MNVLIVGSGAREHAIAWKLRQDDPITKIHAAPGNPGIEKLATCHDVSATDINGLVKLAKDLKVDLVIIGPEDPLAMGLANALESKNIPAFGPSAGASQLESSKVFAKRIMTEAGVPTARAMPIGNNDRRSAETYLDGVKYPIVIKADGLALGKGVAVCNSKEEALQAYDEFTEKYGPTILIEDFLEGPECSMFAICDGTRFVYSPFAIQDHKPIGEGNTGPNTGGMGTVTPIIHFDAAYADLVAERIFAPTLREMARIGMPFCGCLYAGLKGSPTDPYVVEFNVRFGDPETQILMTMMDENLAELLYSAATETIIKTRPAKWKSGAAACVVAASAGYPGDYEKGMVITGIEEAESNDSHIFHAGTAIKDGELVTNGGRVLSVVATGADLEQALKTAYNGIGKIHFDGIIYRTDIGFNAL